MKKERIEITKGNNRINFYLVFEGRRHWLFSQEYSMSVYEYFKYGRSVSEMRKLNCWKRNPRLAKTLERIPVMIKYVRKEFELPECGGKRKYYQTTYRDLYTI